MCMDPPGKIIYVLNLVISNKEKIIVNQKMKEKILDHQIQFSIRMENGNFKYRN